MDPDGSRLPLAGVGQVGGSQVTVAARGWRRLVTRPDFLAQRVLRRMDSDAVVVLADDRTVRRLNARFRGRNSPTNVLTFAPSVPGMAGEMVLALGTVRREAARARRRPAHHLAHLVAHGVLHLRGHDHHAAGAARGMEMAEARALGRLGMPNPWRAR